MEEKITLIGLIITLAPFFVGVIGAWIHVKTTVGTLKTKLEFIQKELAEEKKGNKSNLESLTNKIDRLFGKIGEVRELILKNNK